MKKLSELVKEGATRVRVVSSAGTTIFPHGEEFYVVNGRIHPTNSQPWGAGTVNGEPKTLFEDASETLNNEEVSGMLVRISEMASDADTLVCKKSNGHLFTEGNEYRVYNNVQGLYIISDTGIRIYQTSSLFEKYEEPNTLFGIRADKFSNEELVHLAKSVAEEVAKRLL